MLLLKNDQIWDGPIATRHLGLLSCNIPLRILKYFITFLPLIIKQFAKNYNFFLKLNIHSYIISHTWILKLGNNLYDFFYLLLNQEVCDIFTSYHISLMAPG